MITLPPKQHNMYEYLFNMEECFHNIPARFWDVLEYFISGKALLIGLLHSWFCSHLQRLLHLYQWFLNFLGHYPNSDPVGMS